MKMTAATLVRDLKARLDTLLAPKVWTAKIYSNGWKKPGLGTADVIEKATGAKLGEIGIASPEDISVAAAAARQGQREWAKVAGPKRGDVLRKFSRLLLAYSDEIADQIVRETASIWAKAQWEIQMAAREFLKAAALGSQPQGILTATLEGGQQSIARRIPVGVIGIITPWNSPLILGARFIGPALAMGNAVVLKPDVQTPVVGGVFFALLLEEAGLPNGLFHMLPGGPETGAALVKELLIDMISFTGSTRAGRQVGSIAGGQLKRVSLELAGNNPYIVLDDANVEAAASAGAWGAFFPPGTDLPHRRPSPRSRAPRRCLCRSPREKGQGSGRRQPDRSEGTGRADHQRASGREC
jgi:benzaldehyde dehydrogenase (NAD)